MTYAKLLQIRSVTLMTNNTIATDKNPNMAIREALRRIMALLCILAAVWCAFKPGLTVTVHPVPLAMLIPVRPGDAERIKLITAAKNGELSPGQSLQAWTLVWKRNRFVKGHPNEWQAIVNRINHRTDGRISIPLNDIPNPRYKFVKISDNTAMMVDMSYPLRELVPFWLLGALLVYVLIPWPPNNSDIVFGRKRWGSIILPDWVGLIITGCYMVLVIPAVTGYSIYPGPMPGLQWSLMYILSGTSFMVVAWYNSCTYVRLTNQQLELRSPRGMEDVAYGQIESIELCQITAPGWVQWIALVMAPFTLCTVMYASKQLLETRSGAIITMRYGDAKRYVLDNIVAYDELLTQLQAKSSCKLIGFDLPCLALLRSKGFTLGPI
ncbi:MAG: hypothetical protein ACYC1M_19315 [Armatimonadota bacterium]